MKGYAEAIEPTYSNGARVATSTSEFTFDFWWTSPDSDQPTTIARIILSPPIAKRFAKLLEEQIQAYEEVAGQIQVKGPEKPHIGYLK